MAPYTGYAILISRQQDETETGRNDETGIRGQKEKIVDFRFQIVD